MPTQDMVSLGPRGQCDFIGPSSRCGVTQNTASGNTPTGTKFLGLQALSGHPVHQSSCKLHAIRGLRR